MEIVELKGHHKACKNCGDFFRSVRSDATYCGSKCGRIYRKKKFRRKARLQAIIARFGLGVSDRSKLAENKTTPSKIEYSRLTFILSLLGFLGSIGFYLGVLREVYSPAKDKQRIEMLQEQNQQLQKAVTYLVTEQEGRE